MKTYLAARLGVPDWSKVETIKMQHAGWRPICDIEAQAQVCHDGSTIYVRLEAKEADIRAELTHPLDMICEDSCLEFFFAPCKNDHRYFNFEWNPIGNLYLGFGGPRNERVRQIVDDVDALFTPHPYKTDDGWGIEFAIPVFFIKWYFPDFSLENECACNFYKCGGKTKTPHNLYWSPITSATPDYHRRFDFGRIVFQ